MFVHQDFKEIHLLLALKQAVVKTLTALQMRNVGLFLVVSLPEENVNRFVIQATVLLEQIVQLGTTESPVNVGFHYKEMAMQLV